MSDSIRGLWPLPGGADAYAETLFEILARIGANGLPEEDLITWMRGRWGLKGERAPSEYLRIVVERCFQAISDHDGVLVLTPQGKALLRVRDRRELSQILRARVEGYETAVAFVIRTGPVGLEKVNDELQRVHNFGWTEPYQTDWRLKWALSVGDLKRVARKWVAPEAVDAPVRVRPPQAESGEAPARRRSVAPRNGEGGDPAPETDWGSVLTLAARDSERPDRFESLLSDFFAELGFETERLGGAGRTDVVVSAPFGVPWYDVIVEAKTTAKPPLANGSIDWPGLAKHKREYEAQYVVIVADSFAGGALLENARDQKVCLFGVQDLVAIWSIHRVTPITQHRFRNLLETAGTLPAGLLDDLRERTVEQTNSLDCLRSIVGRLEELARQEETGGIATSELYHALWPRFRKEDVQNGVAFLRALPFGAIREDSDGHIHLAAAPRTLRRMLDRYADSVMAALPDEKQA